MVDLIKLELKTLIKSPLFYFSIIGIIIILFQETFPLIQNRNSLTNVYVFIISVDLGLIGLIAPALSVIPYGSHFCHEIKNKYYFYITIRKKKNDYLTSRFVSGILSSGITLSTGFLVFIVLISAVFPIIDSKIPEHVLDLSGTMWQYSYNVFGGFNFFFLQVLIAFIFGMFSGAISLMTAALTLDIYATIAIPFIFNYYLIYFAQRFNLSFLDLSIGLAPTLISKTQYFNVLTIIIIIIIVSYIIYKKIALRRTSNG